MICLIVFFKRKTAYEMRISDWSSDVCSSDLRVFLRFLFGHDRRHIGEDQRLLFFLALLFDRRLVRHPCDRPQPFGGQIAAGADRRARRVVGVKIGTAARQRSEEHTSELQSLMRISYAVFCLKKKKQKTMTQNINTNKSTRT